LSVPDLEFLLHYKVFQEGHDANHQATTQGISRCQEWCHAHG
jgi:hypothetical protein